MKTLERGEIAPYGFYRRSFEPQFLCLRLPLFPWYGDCYRGSDDSMVRGWHFRSLIAKLVTADVVISEKSKVEYVSWNG